MSAEKVIFNLLKNYAPLVAKVPVARIYPSVIPLTATLPAISYNHVSTVEETDIGLNTEVLRSRVQVTVAVSGTDSQSYAKVKELISLITAACNHKQGTFNGVITNSVIRDVLSPDFRDDDSGVSYQSIDFRVVYKE